MKKTFGPRALRLQHMQNRQRRKFQFSSGRRRFAGSERKSGRIGYSAVRRMYGNVEDDVILIFGWAPA
jgi:hypothetical protein